MPIYAVGVPPVDLAELFDGKRILICLGETDTGKTTAIRELTAELVSRGERVVGIDLDMGQSTFGPPETIGLRRWDGRRYLYFVGNITPFGILREVRKGIEIFHRLIARMRWDRIVVDTCGLVRGDFAIALKRMEIEAIGVDFALVLDRGGETSPLVESLTRSRVAHVVLCPGPSVATKSPEHRARYRQHLFQSYLAGAEEVRVSWREKRVSIMVKELQRGQVVGLVSRRGLLVALGVLMAWDEEDLVLWTHRAALQKVALVKIGRYGLRSCDLPWLPEHAGSSSRSAPLE